MNQIEKTGPRVWDLSAKNLCFFFLKKRAHISNRFQKFKIGIFLKNTVIDMRRP